MEPSISENDYVRQVLAAYRQTPTTAGRVHRQDRFLAAQLYKRGIPLAAVENALVLGAVRRLYRDLNAPPLAPVRSLHYFSGLIEEVLTLKVNAAYFQYLRYKIENFEQAEQRFLQVTQSRPT
jgi:hypothetical protein